MNKIILIIAVFILYSCDKKNETVSEPSTASSSADESDSITQSDASQIVGNNTANLSKKAVDMNMTSTQTPTQTPPQQALQYASGSNPPHGQPSHRCDIPVGAPLSTPLQSKKQENPNVIVPSTPSQKPMQAPENTAPGINPPHGQPGHRCDVQVGAPLPTN